MRFQRGVRQLGIGGTSLLSRPPQVLAEPDQRPNPDSVPGGVHFGTSCGFGFGLGSGGHTLLSTVAIAATPDAALNVLVIASTVAPDVPAGWSLTIDSGIVYTDSWSDDYHVYALEGPADATTSVDITFASPANGSLVGFWADAGQEVKTRDYAALGDVPSFTEDWDPTDPPSTIVASSMTLVTGSGGFTITPGGWTHVQGSDLASIDQYVGNPPSTTWAVTGSWHLYGWLMWEIGDV